MRVSLFVPYFLAAHNHLAMAMRPAHIRHGHEETGRQAMQARHLRRQHRRLAAEAHRADTELIGLHRSGVLRVSPVPDSHSRLPSGETGLPSRRNTTSHDRRQSPRPECPVRNPAPALSAPHRVPLCAHRPDHVPRQVGCWAANIARPRFHSRRLSTSPRRSTRRLPLLQSGSSGRHRRQGCCRCSYRSANRRHWGAGTISSSLLRSRCGSARAVCACSSLRDSARRRWAYRYPDRSAWNFYATVRRYRGS